MNWALTYYLYTTIYTIVVIIIFLAWINIIPLVFIRMFIEDNLYDEDRVNWLSTWKKYLKYSVVILIISTFFAIIIPNENQLVKLFGIHISQKIYEGNTEAVNKIPSQLLDIINSIKTEEE